ncbi:methyltransferase domain-containing protein [bacterium]|nr:methyltransferase domain-containing protein [bacterium]
MNIITIFWKSIWELRAKIHKDPLRATGRDLNPEVYPHLAQEISEKLHLVEGDYLIDIGCAKGALDLLLSTKVSSIMATDYSQSMIDCAIMRNSANNIEFRQDNGEKLNLFSQKFNKILIYSVFHYFSSLTKVKNLLIKIFEKLPRGGEVLIGDLPDKNRRQLFPRRYYCEQKGIKRIVEYIVFFLSYHLWQWFTKDSLSEICKQIGFEYSFLPQETEQPTSRDRFDLWLKKN